MFLVDILLQVSTCKKIILFQMKILAYGKFIKFGGQTVL